MYKEIEMIENLEFSVMQPCSLNAETNILRHSKVFYTEVEIQ